MKLGTLALAVALAAVAVSGAGARPDRTELGEGRRDRLRGRVADGRVPEDRAGREVLVRRLERARHADPQGRTRGRVRLREHDAPEGPEQGRLLLEAGRLHAQHARRDRAEVEPGEHQQRLRPAEAGRQGRDRGLRRAGRQLHAAGAEEHEPVGRAFSPTSSARRPTCARCWRRSRSARATRASSTRPTRGPCPARSRS